ncbi:UDP-glucuronosyltransferase 2B23 [Lasiodiplodia hormozganensis]|uniref:UDP-glucuronosyltransferase 2B23 n=1 Tax=Lasiodiplodia hormozganensis TaxID=869390 RepID=A0AA39Z582_9PEZI|nr:UDP-glucuronosyltransferase 2B23 [Lasiodiplodia hormozganensis]
MEVPHDDHDDGFKRKIMLLSTVGGYTHAAPILQLGAVLAARGHTITFATNAGQEHWARSYPFISAVHTLGPALPADVDDDIFARSYAWSAATSGGLGAIFASKRAMDAHTWADSHAHLRRLCAPSSPHRPDLILADYFSDAAATDMLREHGVAVAVLWPQFPFAAPSAKPAYVPGVPGFQPVPATTSEGLSVWQRLRNEVVLLRALPHVRAQERWTREMRRRAGAARDRPMGYERLRFLVLVNSFFGLETPRPLPPLMAAVGPVLADSWAPLESGFERWLDGRRRVVYVSLGTHVVLPEDKGMELMKGLVEVLRRGGVDGVVWALPEVTRKRFDRSKRVAVAGNGAEEMETEVVVGDVLDGKLDGFMVMPFAPQRAVLDHPHVTLFLTHAGGSSANEATYHGVRVLCLPVWFDQLANAVRLVDAGVGLKLDKFAFHSDEVVEKIETVVRDEDGMFAKNVQRLKRIARIAAKGKHRAADLIEEVLADWEGGVGKGERPMHLQTADCRMSTWKARNWDLWAVVMGITAVSGGLTWWGVRAFWLKRNFVGGLVGKAWAGLRSLTRRS